MIKITVDGKPATQGNHRVNKWGATYETSKSIGPWREAIRAEVQRQLRDPDLGAGPVTGPACVVINFRLTRPKSHYRSGRNAHLVRDGAPAYPASKPDADKLARAVLDGLTAGGAYGDDGQVVDLTVSKRYDSTAGAEIYVTEVQ